MTLGYPFRTFSGTRAYSHGLVERLLCHLEGGFAVHVLIALLVAAVLTYLIYRAFFAGTAAAGSSAPGARSERGFAFLSNGLIFYRERGGELKELVSPYAQQAMDRRERSR